MQTATGAICVHVDCSGAAAAGDWDGKHTRECETVLAQTLQKASVAAACMGVAAHVRRARKCLAAAFDMRKLVCAPMLAWTLYVDCVVMSDGAAEHACCVFAII